MDELEAQIAHNRLLHECCLLTVRESPAAVQLADHTIHRQDRNKEASGKSGGEDCACLEMKPGAVTAGQ